MKKRITTYTFDASAKTITFSGPLDIEGFSVITNVVDNIIIYQFNDPLLGGTFATNTLTLTYNTASMSDTDELMILYDDGVETQTVSGTVTANLGAVDNAVLDDIASDTEAIKTSLAAVGGLPVDLGTNNDVTVTSGAITETNSGAIKTAVEKIDDAISGTEMQVDVVSMPTTTVQATNLDIRDLANASDSVAIYGSDDGGTTKRIIKTDAGGAIQMDLEVANVTVNNGAGASAVNIQDGGNSLTVDGTITANLSATDNAVLDDISSNTGAIKTSLETAGGQLVNLGANNDVTVTGSVTANAGTNLNTSALALETGGNLASIKTNTDKIPALGQALAAASVPVVLPAAQITTLTPPAAITGFATSAKQDTIISHIDGIEGYIDGIEGLLTTVDADTSNISTKIDTVAGAVAGTEMQVDVLTMPTTTVQGTVTANLSATDNAVLDDIAANQTDGTQKTQLIDAGGEAVTITGGKLDVNASVDTTGLATSAKQDDIITAIGAIPGGGGVQYTEGDIDASATGTVAMMEVGSDTLEPIQGTVAGGLLVNLGGNNDVTVTGTVDLGATDNAVLDSIAAKDFATQTTLAAMNAKMVTGTDIGDVTINNSTGAAAVNIQDGGNSITVDGSVTANAGTNLNTSALALESGGNLAAIKAKTDNIPALGQALAAGSVPVVMTAAQLSTLTPPAAITGFATSAKQDTIIGHIDGIEGYVDGIEGLLTTIDADTSNLSVVGGGTEATALRVTIANNSTGVLSVDDNGGALTVDGAVTVTNATAANLNMTEASAASIKTAVELLDNSVDGNYLNTNMNIAGTDVAGGNGTTSAQTQRVTISSDSTGQVKLAAGTAAIGKLTANSGVDIGDVDILSIAAGNNNIGDVDIASIAAGTNIIGKVGHDITGVGHGVKTVTTAGTDVALAASTTCKKVDIQAQTDNTGLIAVGGSGVDATEATGTGIILEAGDIYTLEIDNLADIYIDSTVNGEGVRYCYYS